MKLRQLIQREIKLALKEAVTLPHGHIGNPGGGPPLPLKVGDWYMVADAKGVVDRCKYLGEVSSESWPSDMYLHGPGKAGSFMFYTPSDNAKVFTFYNLTHVDLSKVTPGNMTKGASPTTRPANSPFY